MQSSPRPTSLSYYLHLLNLRARLPAPPRPRPDAFIWHGAVLHRCRGDQDCHVARLPRYASNAAFPIPLLSSHLPGSRPSSCTAEKAVGGVYLRLVPLRTPPTPSPRCRSPPRWSVAYDVRSDQECRSLPGTIYSTTTAHAIRPTTWTSPQTRSAVSARPSCSTPRRPHVASSPSRTPWLFSSVLPSLPDAWACRTPWHHPHHLLCAQCAQWSFPITGAAFIASSRAKCVCNKSLSPIYTHAGRIINTARTTPLSAHLIARAAAITFPPAAAMSNASLSSSQTQLLSGTGSTTRSIAGAHSKCNERSRRPCRLHRSPRPAPASSAPTPVAASNLGLLRNANTTGTILRDAQHTPQLSPHRPIPSPPPIFPSPAPATSADDTAAGWQRTDHPEAMCTPRLHRYPHSTLGISDKRGWGTATSLGATNRGGDDGAYAASGFQIPPWPVQLESPARAASTGRGIA
ncbi:hypothetical protein B0H14DRAFT_3867590 [Mycena olivaceomarginata]|nr:hypothetical protein B0H14DRAFT_3867590 [Mycena olivaceomarginata]